ncbi:pimeloyl-ACP methyl ester carboxylesterase [Herbihabitans rhizosphaerae]|uniref:Pimeloyl-ACP methyl ester carboxylesterase n=1 Tax=Herbihabitans rhizosphaerae TaxID=1872711 RepID=A0A4Q7KW56_9PSEU|nr:alpha/beta hydrolase [Herbihabitans rhizosphaerae]RZS41289.1 pimeloyl-ACP methyl ester carboxylesterase [Herbihabitans rhizosphaerae]
MSQNRRHTRRAVLGALLAAVPIALGVSAGQSGAAEPVAERHHGPKPTVVLVHGAFADSSSWNGVIRELTRDGYPVVAAANPLRDLAADSAYVAGVAAAVKGPVLLAGHSYGGAVITNAARQAPNVAGLVYVAGFAPDTGESVLGISDKFPRTPLADAVRPQPIPGGVDIYIDRAAFRSVFAQDVHRGAAELMAITQRPMAGAAGGTPSGEPAWRTLPSWSVIARHDNALHPEAQRFFARRMAARETVELDASHAVMVSRPDAVTRLIEKAARSIA